MMEGLRARFRAARKLLHSKHRGELSIKNIIVLVIGLFVAAILMPPAIDNLEYMSTGMYYYYGNYSVFVPYNPAVVTVTKVLLPILALIAIALYFIPKLRGD
jgi:hypothetical protein